MSDKAMHGDEVAKHNSEESCYVIVHGQVYDVTEFLPEHPGGKKIILKYAGKDATEEYDPIHPPGTLEENLPKEKCLGKVDMSTVKKEEKKPSQADKEIAKAKDELPPLELCLNLYDFEVSIAWARAATSTPLPLPPRAVGGKMPR